MIYLAFVWKLKLWKLWVTKMFVNYIKLLKQMPKFSWYLNIVLEVNFLTTLVRLPFLCTLLNSFYITHEICHFNSGERSFDRRWSKTFFPTNCCCCCIHPQPGIRSQRFKACKLFVIPLHLSHTYFELIQKLGKLASWWRSTPKVDRFWALCKTKRWYGVSFGNMLWITRICCPWTHFWKMLLR